MSGLDQVRGLEGRALLGPEGQEMPKPAGAQMMPPCALGARHGAARIKVFLIWFWSYVGGIFSCIMFHFFGMRMYIGNLYF